MATVNDGSHISNHTIEKVTKAKFILEHYYNNLVNETEERENRFIKIFNVFALKFFTTFVIVLHVCTGIRSWKVRWKAMV